MMTADRATARGGGRKGRGAGINPAGRFERLSGNLEDDGWGSAAEVAQAVPATTVTQERARTIITRNDSPDIGFDRSINSYRGCEHGCVYCFARPSHAHIGLSPGLDFETRLYVKPDAARLLEKELAAPAYVPRTIAIGTNTDPYQPIEREHRSTRAVLEVLARTRHPVGIVTKSHLVTRDLDILSEMGRAGIAKVAISLTTLDRTLSRRMEPRAPAPERRLEAIAALSAAGVPVMALVAPVVPAINDHEVERLVAAAAEAGASHGEYVVLRLPREVSDIVRDWLGRHYPDRARRVMSIMRAMRGGRDYDARWGTRMRGTGPFAELVESRFDRAARAAGLSRTRIRLRTDLFRPPRRETAQLSLFGD